MERKNIEQESGDKKDSKKAISESKNEKDSKKATPESKIEDKDSKPEDAQKLKVQQRKTPTKTKENIEAIYSREAPAYLPATLSIVKDITADPCSCSSLREAVVYVIFVILYISYVICTNHSYKVYKGNTSLKWHFEKGWPRLYEINDFGSIYPYLETMIRGVVFTYYDWDHIGITIKKTRKHLGNHIRVGQVVLRQLKTSPNSCKVTNGYFKTCFSMYNEKSEDKTSFGTNRGTAFTWNKGAWKHSIGGQFQSYPRSTRGFYLIYQTGGQAIVEMNRLIDNEWISRGTRVIFLELVVYHPNNRLLTSITVIFEISPAGYIWTYLDLQSMNSNFLDMFLLQTNEVLFWFQFVPLLPLPFFLLDMLTEIVYFKFRYFKRVWTYIDLSILILVPTLYIITYVAVTKCRKYVKDIKKNPNSYINPGELLLYNTVVGYLKIFALIVISLKLFKFTTIFGVMGQIVLMLETCAADLFRVLITFILVLNAFALYMMCVNVTLEEEKGMNFKYYTTSLDTLLRVATGNLVTSRSRVYLFPLYFFYCIFFFMVDVLLASIIMAILNNGYMEFMTELVFKTSRKSYWDKITGKSNISNAPLENLMIWLKILKVKNSKMYMLFSRFNINPTNPNVDMGEFKEELLRSTGILTKTDQVDENKITLKDFNERSFHLEQLSHALKQLKIKMLKFRSKCESIISSQKRKTK